MDKQNKIKKCIQCGTAEVKNPLKNWHAGPTCNKCWARKYRQNNKEKIANTINNWRKNNIERHKESGRQWRINNKEHKGEQCRQWRLNNIDRVRIASNNYQKRKELADPSYKVARRLRARFYKLLKNKDKQSYHVLSKYVSYTYDDAVSHIESLFEPGMSWDNYGVYGWHIDHIKPLCSFDLTNKDEIIQAWQLSNLRPIWCTDNWEKSKQDRLCKKV